MKLLPAILLVLLLCGCADASALPPEKAPQPEETFFRESSADHSNPRWTEQELLTAFYQYAEEGTVVEDCVILEESACGIVGVVQYTLPDSTECWFDFIRAQEFPRRAGVDALPADGNTLICAGVDSISCTLLDKDGAEFTCTLSYYENPEGSETGFRIVTD